MNKEELLNLYLEKLRLLTIEQLDSSPNLSVIKALKQSLIYLEGELSGY